MGTKDFTADLIDAVLELNKSKYDRLSYSNPLLIKHNLSPTPINFWKINVKEHKHSLQVAEQNQVIAQLYPEAEVSMTQHGIKFNDLYYSCPRVVEEELTAIARTKGMWKMDARINENTTNYIFVRLKKNEGFTKCNLLTKSNMFANQPMYESEVYLDWKGSIAEVTPITTSSIESQKTRKAREKLAKSRVANDSLKYSQRSKDVRQNRKDELFNTSNVLNEKDKSPPTIELQNIPNNIADKQNQNNINFLPRRPKGKK